MQKLRLKGEGRELKIHASVILPIVVKMMHPIGKVTSIY